MSFNPSDIFDELQKSGLDPSIFETIDERSFDKAPNFLEWVIGPSFLNTSILPKQVEMGAKLFADYCPRCSNSGFIDKLYDQSVGVIRDNIRFLEHGICPKCKVTRYELIKNDELNQYYEIVGCMGQRSGKTKAVGLLGSYVLHRYLKIPNPLRFFGQPSGEMLSGTFSALTLQQAKSTSWESFRGFIDASPWFQSYHKFLKEEGKRLGIELFSSNKTEFHYKHKQMYWNCTGSEDRKLRGSTRIWASIDELGWFVSDDAKKDLTIMNADGVYTALSNSLSTMKMKYSQLWGPNTFDAPFPIMANTSSPSSVKDKIMRLVRDAQQNKTILAFHCPSWEANPDYTYDTLRNMYAHMTETDFMRDYGAEPPLASNPFLDDPIYVDKIAVGGQISNVEVEKVQDKDAFGDLYQYVKAKIKNPDNKTSRLLSFDLGYKKNGLAACLFSLTAESRIKLDLAVNLIPSSNSPINIVKVFDNFTIPLVENFNIMYAFFDRWNSLDQIQRLRDHKVDASIYSLTYQDMMDVKSMITTQSLVVPKLGKNMSDYVSRYIEDEKSISNEPVATLGIQLLTVRDIGSRVAKPLQGDDDLFRAFCLGVNRLNDNKIRKEMLAGPKVVDNGQVVRALGTVRSLRESGGGFGGGSVVSGIGSVRSRRGNR